VTTIDLDALKAARAEQKEETHELIFGGKTFVLPLEMPLEFLEALADVQRVTDPKTGIPMAELHRLRQILVPVLDGQAEEFFKALPSEEDYTAAIQGLSQIYLGAGTGEPQASGASSKTTSRRSRPPSPKSTQESDPSPS